MESGQVSSRTSAQGIESRATSREAGEQEQHLEWWGTQIYLGNLGNPTPPRTSLTLTVRLGRGPPQFPRIIFVGVPHHSGYYSWGSPASQTIADGASISRSTACGANRWGWIKKSLATDGAGTRAILCLSSNCYVLTEVKLTKPEQHPSRDTGRRCSRQHCRAG